MFVIHTSIHRMEVYLSSFCSVRRYSKVVLLLDGGIERI